MRLRGFTLTEVLVVLAVVGVLAGAGYPVTRSFIANSREAACLNNLRSLGVGLEGFMQDHQQRLPILSTGRSSRGSDDSVLEVVLLPYLESGDSFRCPQDREQFDKSGSSYSWFSMANGQMLSQLAVFNIKGRPDKIPLIHDKESWHPSGTNFLYADLSGSNKARFAADN